MDQLQETELVDTAVVYPNSNTKCRSQEALGFIRKELAHGTGVLLNWKQGNCDSGAVIAVAAVISDIWLARLLRFFVYTCHKILMISDE